MQTVHPVITRRNDGAHSQRLAAQGQSQEKKWTVFFHRSELADTRYCKRIHEKTNLKNGASAGY
jgi:hypothetical protein